MHDIDVNITTMVGVTSRIAWRGEGVIGYGATGNNLHVKVCNNILGTRNTSRSSRKVGSKCYLLGIYTCVARTTRRGPPHR